MTTTSTFEHQEEALGIWLHPGFILHGGGHEEAPCECNSISVKAVHRQRSGVLQRSAPLSLAMNVSLTINLEQ